MNESLRSSVERVVSGAIGSRIEITSTRPVSGGCINDCWFVTCADEQRFFVKSNPSSPVGMFIAEAAGLAAIRATKTIAVPETVALNASDSDHAFLVLELIATSTRADNFDETFGQQLAELHRVGGQHQFGFATDNFLGSARQLNQWTEHWVDFWRTQRLEFQLNWALQQGYSNRELDRSVNRLLVRLDEIIGGPDVTPSLVHGDLWSGNYLAGSSGEPVLIDPATYFGSREAEFGMTTLFGGFPPRFYDAYNEAWPLDDGWQDRVAVYRLYHLLNHLNLFGTGYLADCIELSKRFC